MKSKSSSPSAPVAVVVNDDPTQLTMICRLLTKAGINTTAFTGAEDALAGMTATDSALPSLIVTDLYMPGIDGWRFCRLLRSPEYAAFNNIPILVISATYTGEEPDRIAFDLGAEGFLSSPVDGKLLSQLVKAILNKEQIRKLPRVLIVEDTSTLAGMLRKSFKAQGYEADIATTIREASEAFARTTFDVAVIDYHLPDGTGDSLLDLFCESRPDCVCLMMTTDPEQSLALDWMKRGAAAYLRKPFKPEYLINLCENARRERGLLRVQNLLEARTRELRSSEEKYRQLFDHSPVGLYEIDFVKMRITKVNSVICKDTGYSEDELLAISPFDLLTEESRQRFLARIEKILRDEPVPTNPEFCVRIKDGRTMWAELNIEFLRQDGKITGAAVAAHDITDRKRAQEALRESEERYRALFDRSLDCVYVHDFEGNFLDANDACLKLLGYTREEIPSVNFAAMLSDDQIPRAVNALQEILDKGFQKNSASYRLKKKNGDFVHVDVIASAIMRNGKPYAIQGVARDITESRKEEENAQRILARRQRELDIVTAIATSTHLHDGELRELATELTQASAGALDVERVSVWLFEEDETRLVNLDLFLLSSNEHSSGAVLLKSEFQNEFAALRNANYVDAHDALTDHRTAGYVDSYLKPNRIKSMLDAVIRGSNRNLGLICFEHVDRPHRWEEDEITFACQLADQIALAIAHKERVKAQEALRQSEEKYRAIFDTTGNATIIINKDTTIILANAEFVELSGYTTAELEGKLSWTEFAVKEDLERMRKYHTDRRTKTDAAPKIYEFRFVDRAGNIRHCINNVAMIAGTMLSVASIMDITDRKQAEEALRESQLFMRETQAIAKLGGWKANPRTDRLEWDDGVFDIIEESRDYHPGLAEGMKYYHSEYLPAIKSGLENCLDTGNPFALEVEITTAKGNDRWVEVRAFARTDSGGKPMVMGTMQDITDRKQAEEEKKKINTQLTQSQKMESIGRLAGGVAHDFNNMLSVIIGYSELGIRKSNADNPLKRHLIQILDAAKRSAALTRQLLAFARQQTIAPIVIDLNITIDGMLIMLQRLIGENIDLQWHPGSNVWPVKIDPSQIDQILANLCVNARDAISDVGKVTIETRNATLDEEYCARHPGFAPGDYVKITVTDDGYGMVKEVQARLFEPFFTTKEMGRGTGLGLATVYGIVKQNKGFINVYSDLGHGTAFTIYLLRHIINTAEEKPDAPAANSARGNETILLVEDEPAILAMARTMLEEQGYTVQAAVTPGEALRLASEHRGAIDLLVTDVVMPEMNGRDLAKKLLAIYPKLKRLFMSGYTANVIAHHGVLDEGVCFIQKPFSIDDLAAKIREALEKGED